MAKPTELPRWGTDETNETEPSEGQKSSGWVNSQTPPSGYENWIKRVTYTWCAWADDVFDDDDATLTINRDIATAGDVSADTLTATGSIEGADLTVTGGVVAGGQSLHLLRHATYRISAAGAQNVGTVSGDWSLATNGHLISTGAGHAAVVPLTIPLAAGDTITEVRVYFNKDDDAGDLSATFIVQDNALINTAGDTYTEGDSGPGVFTIDSSDSELPYTIGAGDFPAVRFVAADTGDALIGVEVDVTRTVEE
jgi:hypothetical protein